MTDQPDFLNGCLRMKTLYYPKELLRELNRIEKEAGRERIIHWGPRTLDLDIIFYDDLISQEDDLCIPHVEMHKRSFVLEPLRKSHHTNGTRKWKDSTTDAGRAYRFIKVRENTVHEKRKTTCRQKQITRYEKRWPYESDREPYNSGIIV